jgi:uncharacterized protein with ParB-like and HNH nuclease domain
MVGNIDSIDFESLGIGEALKRYRIEVPKFQRDYAWTANEVETYLKDISTAIETEDTQYFLGTLVTIKRNNDRLEVVDGQQRLATTAIIFAAMRHLANSNSQLDRFLAEFLTSVDSDSLEEELRIKLNIADSDIFNCLILNDDLDQVSKETRPSHNNLIQAYNLAKEHLAKAMSILPDDKKLLPIQKYAKYLQFHIKVILLKVSDDTSAFRMFETLNDRGLRVSQSDLIKNYIFGQAGADIDKAQQHWTSVRTTLEQLDDRSIVLVFIWHALISTDGYVEQKNMYGKIKNIAKGRTQCLKRLGDWENLSQYYVDLANPDSSRWSKYPSSFKEALRVLNLFNIQPLRPLLLAAAFRLKPAVATAIFVSCISIGVRLIIASRTTTQSVLEPLSNAAHGIWMNKIKTKKELIQALVASIPNDDKFREAFEVATVSNAKFARYYLRSLELHLGNRPEPWFIPNDDPAQITLERNPITLDRILWR